EQHHGARILVAGGGGAACGGRKGGGRPVAPVGPRARGPIPPVPGGEKVECARALQPRAHTPPLPRRARRGAGGEVRARGRGARARPVVGGGIARRRLVMRARLVPPPQRFRRAPLPIARARERDRVAALGDFGEVRERGGRIVEEAQRNPAGGE